MLFYGLYQNVTDRETVAVSLLPSGDSGEGSNGVQIVKIRTFVGPTGVRKEEWAVATNFEVLNEESNKNIFKVKRIIMYGLIYRK